jgi:type I restriction enzyme M protein
MAKAEKSDPDEIKALEGAVRLYDAEAAAKKALKEAQAGLDLAALKNYGDLTEDEVESLVLDDKWASTIRNRVVEEVNALTLSLVSRIQQLGDRYAVTAGDLEAELERQQARVAAHLISMGVAQ